MLFASILSVCLYRCVSFVPLCAVTGKGIWMKFGSREHTEELSQMYVLMYIGHKLSRDLGTNFPPIIVINSQPPIQEHYIIGWSGLQQEITVLSKEDVPTWCKQFYYYFVLINGLYMFRSFTCSSSGVLIYRLFHCRMWCYAIGVEAVVLRSWCVVSCYLSLRYLCTCSTSDRCSWLNPRNVFPKYGYSSRNILFIRRKKKPSITNKCWKFYWRSKIRCGCTACTYMHIHLQNTTA